MWLNRAAPLLPAPPAVTFQSTFDELNEPVSEWIQGVQFRGDEDTSVHTFPWCEDVTNQTTTVDQNGSTFASFEPFQVYASAACDSVLESEDPEYVELVRRKLDVGISYSLAQQLNSDTFATGNSNLAGSAVDATPNTGSVDLAIGALIQKFTDATHGSGKWFLHAPMILLPFLMNDYIVEEQDGKFIGPEGRPVAVLPGYDGTLSTGKATVYISGAVEYAIAPYRTLPVTYQERTVQGRTNKYVVYAKTNAILRFDPTLVFKATAAVS